MRIQCNQTRPCVPADSSRTSQYCQFVCMEISVKLTFAEEAPLASYFHETSSTWTWKWKERRRRRRSRSNVASLSDSSHQLSLLIPSPLTMRASYLNSRRCRFKLACPRRIEENKRFEKANERFAETNSLLQVGSQLESERVEKQPPAGVFNKRARFSLLQFGFVSVSRSGSISSLLVENEKAPE